MFVDRPRGRAESLTKKLSKKRSQKYKAKEPRPARMTRLDNVAAEWIKLLETNMKQPGCCCPCYTSGLEHLSLLPLDLVPWFDNGLIVVLGRRKPQVIKFSNSGVFYAPNA
jgi:hypothetical protein